MSPICLNRGVHNPSMQADAEDFTGGQTLSICQEPLTPLQEKGRLSRTWWPDMSHTHWRDWLTLNATLLETRGGAVGEQLGHAELWATVHQLQGLENVA